jgi:hypothetical protein
VDYIVRSDPEAYDATLPARQAANAEQIAPVVAFLASEEASFIYGAVVHADGRRVTGGAHKHARTPGHVSADDLTTAQPAAQPARNTCP